MPTNIKQFTVSGFDSSVKSATTSPQHEEAHSFHVLKTSTILATNSRQLKLAQKSRGV
jgi:hypothetical protein